MVTKVTKILHILYNVVHLLRTPLFPLQNNSGKAVTSVTGGFWLPFGYRLPGCRYWFPLGK